MEHDPDGRRVVVAAASGGINSADAERHADSARLGRQLRAVLAAETAAALRAHVPSRPEDVAHAIFFPAVNSSATRTAITNARGSDIA
jgi:hypothetical protein